MDKGAGCCTQKGLGCCPRGHAQAALWQELWVPLLDPGTQLPWPPVWRGRPGPSYEGPAFLADGLGPSPCPSTSEGPERRQLSSASCCSS